MSETELELYEIIGKMLRNVRESKKYTLETVSEKLNIATITLSRYECGERKIKIETIKALCELYDIDYYEFIKKAKTKFSSDVIDTNYYLNDETAQIAQEIFENKELRMLFDASRGADPEDLKALHSMALALKRKERGTDV